MDGTKFLKCEIGEIAGCWYDDDLEVWASTSIGIQNKHSRLVARGFDHAVMIFWKNFLAWANRCLPW
jgi:hypothetical protein